jgi:hypothetical protein
MSPDSLWVTGLPEEQLANDDQQSAEMNTKEARRSITP